MMTKENYKNNYEVHDTPYHTIKVIVSGKTNIIYEVDSKIFNDNLENFLNSNDDDRIVWLRTHAIQMNQILGRIVNEATWIKAKVVEISYSMNYMELILRNGLFCVIKLKNAYETEIRIAELGGFKAIINTNSITHLIAKLSY